MTQRDLAYALRQCRRLADPECPECDGEGTVSYTASGTGEVETACSCVRRTGRLADHDHDDWRI